MATMRLFNPAGELYENSYSYQSAYAKPGYNYGIGQTQGHHYSDCQIQNQLSAIVSPTHASSALMQQSSYLNVNSDSVSPGFGGFPVVPVEQHSSSHAYSQHGSYSMGQQGAYGSSQHGSYGMRKQEVGMHSSHGPYGLGKQEAYSSAHHGSYGSSHNGLLGSVQQGSHGISQKRYSSGNHSGYGLAHQGAFGSSQQSSFGSVAHAPSTNWAMKRRQKISYYRRSNTGFRSGDGSDSQDEEEEEESEDEHP